MKKNRNEIRKKRINSKDPIISLVGYTNAGKSTVLNQLTDAGTYQMDQLFATLDPLTRKSWFSRSIWCDINGYSWIYSRFTNNFNSRIWVNFRRECGCWFIGACSWCIISEFFNAWKTVHDLVEDLEMETIPMVTIYNKSDLIVGEFSTECLSFVSDVCWKCNRYWEIERISCSSNESRNGPLWRMG